MRGIIQWFVDNPIAANLLMVAMLIGGYFGTQNIKKEVFPSNTRNFVYVNMAYPGAAPSEVEQQIAVRIEEAIADLPGIFQIRSESRRGAGNVTIEVIEGFDVKEVLNDVKARVDSINTFPSSSERPIVSYAHNRQQIMFFSLYGTAEPDVMKALGYQIRDEMSVLEGISTVFIIGFRNDEVSIEISEENLQRYNLTFDEVANAIRKTSINVPAGTIRTDTGDIQIQTRAQAFEEAEFSSIPIRSNPDGSIILLGDIAHIRDGFSEDQEYEFSYNGQPGLDFQAFISDDPDLFAGTKNAEEYIENLREYLPEGVNISINYKMKQLFDSRFNLLKDNALGGLILVFIVLMLFLRPLLAFWVVAGITTTFAGAIWLLPYFGISINMLSMFAFLMVLGIVVDDAIIIGESIYSHQSEGLKGTAAASVGAKIVLKPVSLAVISTIIFFTPMITVPEDVKPYTLSIFFVVFLCLSFSLIESLLILPSHLSHMKPEKPSKFRALRKVEEIRHTFSGFLQNFAKDKYQPALRRALKYKGTTFIGFWIAFGISVAIWKGGWINSSFFPSIPQSFIIVSMSVPEGSPHTEAKKLADYVEKIAQDFRDDEQMIEANNGKPFVTEIKKNVFGNQCNVFLGLTQSEFRDVPTQVVSNRLKELIGPLPQAKSYSLDFTFNNPGPDIELNLNIAANDRDTQEEVINAISKVLGSYEGVSNVKSDLDSERIEVELRPKANAETLGINLSDVARQVRQGFYGEEVQRIPRAKEDVRVMLRYPKDERDSLDMLDDLRVRSTNGSEIALEEVAELDLVPGFSSIRRVDRRRNIVITADVDDGFDGNEIVNQMFDAYIPQWKRQYIGFNLSKEGSLRSQARFQDNLMINFFKTTIIMWAFFAIAFRSLAQSLLVLFAVPFGFMGAIFGHLMLGHDISMMSMFGFLACAGVVVNDNLVLLDRVNQLRHRGVSIMDSVLQAGVDRFRPIILTSITTFVGLLPILFERSGQAQFLIPMVISLSFGVLFASTVTLFMVPSSYVICYTLWEKILNVKQSVLPSGAELDVGEDSADLDI